MEKRFYIYILTNRPRGVLYVGVTSDPLRRIWEHREDLVSGFTRKYQTHRLVYIEQCTEALVALNREKQLKRWRRAWKIELVESQNPEWRDLYPELWG